MKGALALRNPVAVFTLDTSSVNIANNAYSDFVTAANMKNPASAISIHNPGAQPLVLATGAAGSEVNKLVIPINNWAMLPIELQNGVRLSLKSLGASQVTGIITMTLYQ